MNNQNSYNKIRFKIMATGLPAFFISLFRKQNKNLIIFNSHFNLQFNENSKYLFLYFLKNRTETVKFVVNNDKLREKLTAEYGDFFIETNSFKGKLFALSARTWFMNSYDLPVGGIFLKKRINVFCLSHGSPIKNEATLEKDVSLIKRIYYMILRTNIKYILATGEMFAKVYMKYMHLSKDKILISGLPQYDQFSSEQKSVPELDNQKFKVLYAPTWRHFGNPPLFDFNNFDLHDFDDFLSDNNILLYMRLHPNYGEEILQQFSTTKSIKTFSGKKFPDIMEYLPKFDAVISDYSSISLDFLPLNKPLIYMTTDIEEYEKQIGFCVDFDHCTPGDKPKTYEEFKLALLDAKNKDSNKALREALIKELNCTPNDNCKRLVQLLEYENIIEKLN